MLRWLIQVWTAYAHRAASYQSHVLLTLIYIVVLGPGALLARLGGARLLDLRPGATSSWTRRGAQEATLEALRRQF